MAVDLDAIRARHREAYGDPATPMGAMRDVAALLAERDRLAATVDRVRALADGWASTGEPATKERQAALHGAARRLRAVIEGADS